MADRVVQHSITWNTLNNAKYIEGNNLTNTALIVFHLLKACFNNMRVYYIAH